MRWKRTFFSATAVVLVSPLAASATPVDLKSGVEIYGGSYSAWQVASAADQCTTGTSPAALAIADGRYGSPAVTDAFDGGHVIIVDGTTIDAPYGTLSGSSVTAGPVYGPGKVWVTHTALAKQPVVRTLVRLTNPGSTTQTHQVTFSSNGGGDAAETTRGTSDGDAVLEPRDAWIVWSTGGADSDPAKATALSGPGRVRSRVVSVQYAPGSPAPSTGTDCLTVTLDAAVPARTTRYLVFFTGIDSSDLGAYVIANDYTAVKPYLFKGISARQRAQTLNWRF